MSLTARFSALFLATLALVLLAFSSALYLTARIDLHRQLADRLDAALTTLAAAAEVHPDSVEWEPQERLLPLGQETGPDRLHWIVFDDLGRRVDHSRNLAPAEMSPSWTPPEGSAALPNRLLDHDDRPWRFAQRRIVPSAANPDPSRIREEGPGFFPALVLTACAPLDPIRDTLGRLLAVLATLSLAVWTLAALSCRRLARNALRPLTRLVESARGLDAADPGWSLQPAGTNDELDDLGRAFNDLLARLHLAYERQKRLGADASHQLRTPLTILIGQIEVALRHDRTPDEYRRVLNSALGRSLHLNQIVEALLFLGRSERDAGLPRGESLDLVAWTADRLAQRADPKIAGSSPPILIDAEPAAQFLIHAHPALLGQWLDNVLDNAIKYGASEHPIRVEIRRDRTRDRAVLAVVDRGPGIPAADLPRVIEPFHRSPEVRRKGIPGVGLGLAIAHRIARAFNSDMIVRSDPDQGCRVELHLPLAPSEPSDLPIHIEAASRTR